MQMSFLMKRDYLLLFLRFRDLLFENDQIWVYIPNFSSPNWSPVNSHCPARCPQWHLHDSYQLYNCSWCVMGKCKTLGRKRYLPSSAYECLRLASAAFIDTWKYATHNLKTWTILLNLLNSKLNPSKNSLHASQNVLVFNTKLKKFANLY